jgi:hypothetical protein
MGALCFDGMVQQSSTAACRRVLISAAQTFWMAVIVVRHRHKSRLGHLVALV